MLGHRIGDVLGGLFVMCLFVLLELVSFRI